MQTQRCCAGALIFEDMCRRRFTSTLPSSHPWPACPPASLPRMPQPSPPPSRHDRLLQSPALRCPPIPSSAYRHSSPLSSSSSRCSSSIRAQHLVSIYPNFPGLQPSAPHSARRISNHISACGKVNTPIRTYCGFFVREHAPARHRRRQSAVLGGEQADRERQSTAERTVSDGAPRDKRQCRSGCLRGGAAPVGAMQWAVRRWSASACGRPRS